MDESRRDMIKKGVVAGGIIWSSPVVLSATSAAAAGTPAPSTTTSTSTPDVCAACCVDCDDFPCPTGQDCFCLTTVEGDCFCMQSTLCPTATRCTSSADCPAGWRCIDAPFSCLEPVCVPPCGTAPGPGRARATGAMVPPV